jgi:hypothetical protein
MRCLLTSRTTRNTESFRSGRCAAMRSLPGLTKQSLQRWTFDGEDAIAGTEDKECLHVWGALQ